MPIDAPRNSKSFAGPTLHPARSTWLTYETFYGLREKPFSLSSDPAFFYNSRSHAKAFEDLQSGISRRESLSVVSGDIGTGKTTLCRAVLKELDQKTFSAFVADPFVSREDLLKVVLMDFGVVSADDVARGRLKGATRTELSYLLYEFLGTLAPLQAFAVVFIDEAQNLAIELLEEIRILSDSDGRQRQLQVVLVGQLELRDKLQLPEMRQVDQRVSVRCSLGPLDRAGVAGYVAHRIDVAGGSDDRVSFSPDAIGAVYEASGGVPRMINRICDRALHQGHLRQAAIIDRAIVEAALPDILGAPHDALAPPVTPARSVAPALRTTNDEHEPRTTNTNHEPRTPNHERPVPTPVAPAIPVAAATLVTPATPVTPATLVTDPTPETPGASNSVDDWFDDVDRSVTIASDSETMTEPLFEVALPPPQVTKGHRVRIRSVPLTHMETVMRVWIRRARMAAIVAVVLGGAGLGLGVAWTVVSQAQLPIAMPLLPVAPHTGPAVKRTGTPVPYSLELRSIDPPADSAPTAVPNP